MNMYQQETDLQSNKNLSSIFEIAKKAVYQPIVLTTLKKVCD